MNNILPIDTHRFEEANDVMTLYTKGYKPYQIAKKLGIKREVVDDHIDEWRESAMGAKFVKDRVEELLAQMDDHFSRLIQELHLTLDAIDKHTDDPQLMAQRTATVKAIADITNKRIDALQKAGLLDAADLGDEIAETERKMGLLLAILREVTADCEVCGPEIKRRAADIDGKSHGHKTPGGSNIMVVEAEVVV